MNIEVTIYDKFRVGSGKVLKKRGEMRNEIRE